MIDYSKLPQHEVACIDCQSFYASVEKADHPEYKNKPLAVAGDPASGPRKTRADCLHCPKARSNLGCGPSR
ncbi:hypothetical protein [Paenibacillus polymyxa]|uniref:Y-family DNA polymerase n=1 Tax=Paenibacillus polymyxa TaxID=1406 RepID=UPI003D6579E6